MDWVGKWAIESPILTFILVLVVLQALKTTVIKIFGKRPIVKTITVSIPEAIAYLRDHGEISQLEAEASFTRQLREEEDERERQAALRPEPPPGRTAWERLSGGD